MKFSEKHRLRCRVPFEACGLGLRLTFHSSSGDALFILATKQLFPLCFVSKGTISPVVGTCCIVVSLFSGRVFHWFHVFVTFATVCICLIACVFENNNYTLNLTRTCQLMAVC